MARQAPVTASDDFEAAYPGASRSATECAMNLVLTGDLVVGRVAEALRPFGLSPAGALVLSMLADAPGPLTPGEIRDRLLVKGPTVTGLLDGLEAAGNLERRRDPADRRRLQVSLTRAGRDLADRFRPAVHAAERPWLDPLSEAERQTLLALLGRVQAHLLDPQ